MALKGKGLWAYRRWELDRALQIAPQMQITHILYKVGQGPRGGKPGFYIEDATQVARQIRQAGYTPLAWSFTTLGDPEFEAQMVLDAFRDGYAGFVFDVEDNASERRAEALTVGRTLREAHVDETQLYLCSYPTPITHHPDLPFNEMGPYCQGGLMPMAYGTYQLPPEIVVDTWTYAQNLRWMAREGLRLPIHPIFGPYYDEHGTQRMTEVEFKQWLSHFATHAPGFLSLYTTAVLEAEYFAPMRAFVLAEPTPPIPPVSMQVEVASPTLGYLNLRSGPGTGYSLVTQVPHESLLDALEPKEDVLAKLRQYEKWLFVRAPEGKLGYAAAWFLIEPGTPPPAPTPPPHGERVIHPVVESPTYGLRLRRGPGTHHEQFWWVPHGTTLTSLEDPEVTGGKLEKQGEWLQVRTPSRREGYVAAWYLRAPQAPDDRQPVEDERLPFGQSAWLFGMHAADLNSDTPETQQRIRALFESQNIGGWVLFTEGIGVNPEFPLNPTHRQRLWDWAQVGYGVVVRLNHGYHPSGTLPTSDRYAAFAQTCARWVEQHLKHDEVPAHTYTWIIQIGNEQNNVNEHPGDHGVIREHITPELYAEAFNKVYTAVKATLPNALIAPGAIDPYHSSPYKLLSNRRYRPIDYFQHMLDGIEALDAIVLHAYTHGPSLKRITDLETFGDPFMDDHYFDFQAYRHFMERIPAKWKHVPVLITETNHVCRGPNAPLCDDPHHQGWENANFGWVREVYREIHAWNSQPYAQQIQGVLLYRWSGDQWRLHDKDQVLADFKQALSNDYRWRALVAPQAEAVSFEVAVAPPTSVPPADDLTQLRGVGPKAAEILTSAGITTFAALAQHDSDWLLEMLREAGYPAVARLVATWPTQARLAAEDKWKTLETFQRSL
ncbi:MAG: SH3 domain-containing protein [Anaerolineae bacterium]